MGITRKEPQASVHAYHSGLAELALANQNALPSRAEKKHSAFILRSQSVTSIGGQQFLFLTLSFPHEVMGGSGGCFLSPSVFFSLRMKQA